MQWRARKEAQSSCRTAHGSGSDAAGTRIVERDRRAARVEQVQLRVAFHAVALCAGPGCRWCHERLAYVTPPARAAPVYSVYVQPWVSVTLHATGTPPVVENGRHAGNGGGACAKHSNGPSSSIALLPVGRGAILTACEC